MTIAYAYVALVRVKGTAAALTSEGNAAPKPQSPLQEFEPGAPSIARLRWKPRIETACRPLATRRNLECRHTITISPRERANFSPL